jgi:DNA polymerase-3 subunit alpha (Gram-positive type)
MGTSFVRGMLKAARPKTFADIVKISGLSHGTDVWLNNAELLVNGKKEDYGTVPFAQVIGCRDDIMITLIQAGLKHEVAFEISEFIRRGLPSQKPDKWEGYQKIMAEHQLPPWYIWSCGQIKYMFPKAHATAYVMMALRIAWFKVHRPLYFYAAYFSKRARDFDLIAMRGGDVYIEQKLDEIQAKGTRATDTEKRLMTVLEVALEMTKRGYQFESIDIHTSAAKDFVITKDNTLRLPFVALDGLGEKVAESIVAAREEKPFQSYEDVKARTLITKTAFDRLMALDALKDLPEDAQLSLFDTPS